MQETSNHPNNPSNLQPELQQLSCRYFLPLFPAGGKLHAETRPL